MAVSLLLWLTLLAFPAAGLAQGTAFTYQGQLTSGGVPAGGLYNFTFALYSTNTGGNPLAGPVTNPAVRVTNGLFIVTLDFGPGIFTGGTNWLDLAVATNGTATFTELSPRQLLTPVPYAIFANTAANVSGPVSPLQIAGFSGAVSGIVATSTIPATNVTGVVIATNLPNNTPLVLTNQGNIIASAYNPYTQGQFKTPPKGIDGRFATTLSDETNLLCAASNMWANGMVANGWNTILLDVGNQTDSPFPKVTNGVPYPALTNGGWLDFDRAWYPSGASNLIAQCHAYGVRVFLYAYNSARGNWIQNIGGTNVYYGVQPGFFGTSYYLGWLGNAITNWGLDGIKDDYSSGNYTNAIMQQAFIAQITARTGKPFYVNVSGLGYQPWYRGLFNSWRVGTGVYGDVTSQTIFNEWLDITPFWVAAPGSLNDLDEMGDGFYWQNNVPVYPVAGGSGLFRQELAFDSMANCALLGSLEGQSNPRFANASQHAFYALSYGFYYDNFDNPLVNAIDDDFTDTLHLVSSNALLYCYTKTLSDGSQAFLIQNRSLTTNQTFALSLANYFPSAQFCTIHDIFRNAPLGYATNNYSVGVLTNDIVWFKVIPGQERNYPLAINCLTTTPWSANVTVPGNATLLASPAFQYPAASQLYPFPNSWHQVPGGVTNTTAICMAVSYTNSFTWFLGGQGSQFTATVGAWNSTQHVYIYGDGKLLTSFNWNSDGSTTNINVPIAGVYNLTVTGTNADGSGFGSLYLGDPSVIAGSGAALISTNVVTSVTAAGLATVSATTNSNGVAIAVFVPTNLVTNNETGVTLGGDFQGVFSGNGAGLTNLSVGGTGTNVSTASLSGALNPVISSNPAVYVNGTLANTNQTLSVAAIGGTIMGAVLNSNAVVMGWGDSYTAGTGQEQWYEGNGLSTSTAWGKILRETYGDGGAAGSLAAQAYGWGNYPALSVNPPGNIWPSSLIATLSPAANGNVVFTSQTYSPYNGVQPMPTNKVNLAGLCYIAAPQGSNFTVTIWSLAGKYTNTLTINGYAATPTFIRTNWPVPTANDYSVYATNQAGTNFLVCPVLLNTNGVQYWSFGFAGEYDDQIDIIGTNMWNQILAAVNPDVLLWNDIHFGSSTNGTDSTGYTNLLVNLLTQAPAKTHVVLVGNPPNVGSDMTVINYWYRLLCQNYGWSYCDLWSVFPSYTTSFSQGLFETTGQVGVHPSMAGIWARAGAMANLMGVQGHP